MNTSTQRRSILPWLLFVGLLIVASSGLFAQQKNSPPSLSPSCLTPLVAEESSSSATEARALLPLIPSEPPAPPLASSDTSLVPEGPLPGELSPSPDGFKDLYGYEGPYYNTTHLDGRVVVLNSSVYTWPASTWKAAGMIRNQTRCPMQIRGVSARLLGPQGELIGTATATLPIDTLRAGEPGPFVIAAPVGANKVVSVEWHVDSTIAPSPARQFDFNIWYNAASPVDGYAYKLYGSVTNKSTTSYRDTSVVVAWLDSGNRVLYVASTTLNPYLYPTNQMDLAAGENTGFLFYTTDSNLATTVRHAANLAIWGTSR